MKNFTNAYKPKARFFIFLLASLFSFAGLLSCKIGLGEAVDTERPEATISESLQANAIIKNSFTISGTCFDDREISKLRIVLSNNDTGVKYLYVSDPSDDTAEIERAQKLTRMETPVLIDRKKNENGEVVITYKRQDTWSLVLNEKNADGEYPLKDGTYNISVYPFDSEPRSMEDVFPAERAIIIDNTAPLLVLSRPSEGDSYGRFFSIAGRVADDANVDLMEIDVFPADAAEDASPLYTIKKENIAPSIDLNAAIFGQEGENGPYESIYGHNPMEGTKQFKCKIRVYDAARSFPQVEGEKGNCSETYYLDSDEKIGAYTENFTIADLYHIMSGVYSPASDRAVVEGLQSEVENWLKEKTGAHTNTNFYLNPENSPKFSLIGGYSAVKTYADIRKAEVLNDENILVKVDAGRDNIALNPDTIGVSLYEVIESENNTWAKAGDGSLISILKPYKDFSGNVLLDEAGLAVRNQSTFEKQGSSYTITTKVSKDMGLSIGHTYLLSVTGCDYNGNEINNLSEEYGFYLTAKGLAPTLTVSSPAENTIYMGSSGEIIIAGETTHDEGVPKVTIRVKKNGTDQVVEFVSGKDGFKVENKAFRKVLKPADFIKSEELEESAQYDITVFSTYSEFSSGEIQKNVIYDIDNPVISDILVTPIADTSALAGGNDHNVNGKIRISGTFSDEKTGVNPESMKCVYTSREGQKEMLISKQQNWSFELDTNTLPDGELNMTFYVSDKAGNKAEKVLFFKESENTKYIVDQNTDNPLVVIDEKQIKKISDVNDEGISSLAKRHTLSGYLLDDDGLDKYTLSVYEVRGGVVSSKNYSEDYGEEITLKNETSKQLSVALPGDDGAYKLVISVTDKKSTGEAAKTTVWETFVRIAGEAPSLSVQEGNNSLLKSDANMTLKLRFSGKNTADNPLKIYLLAEEDKDDAERTNWKEIFDGIRDGYPSGDTVTQEVVVKPENRPFNTNGDYKVIVRACANNFVTDDEVSYSIDDKAPDVPEVKNWTTDTEARITQLDNQLEVTSNDNGSAGLNKILYKYGEETDDFNYDPNNTEGWLESAYLSGKFDINQNFAEGGIPQGKKKIFIYAVDNAGNISDRAVYKFVADTTSPKLTITNVAGDSIAETEIKTNEDFTFNIEAKDPESGILSVAVNGEPISLTDDKGTYSVLAENGEGSRKLNITVQNNAGLSTSGSVTVTVDTTAPEVGIANPAVGSKTGVNAINVEDYHFEGSISDNITGVSSVYWVITSSTQSTAPEKGDPSWNEISNIPAGSALWSVNQKFKSGATDETALGEGSYKLWVYAKDKVGNETKNEAIVSREFDVDFFVPDVKVEAKANSITNESTNDKGFKFEYSASDTSGDLETKSVTVTKDGTEINTGFTDSDGVITFTNPEDGNYKVEVSAKDKAGKETKKSASIKLDTVGPEVTVDSPDVTNYFRYKNIVFSGTASDKESGGSAIAVVYYTTDATEGANPTKETLEKTGDDAKWKKANGTDNWAASVEQGDTTGTTYYFAAIDSVGNVTEPGKVVTKVLKVDTTNPVLEIKNTAETETITSILSQTPYTFNIVCSDATSGIDSVKVNNSTTGVTKVSDGKYTYISASEDGKYKYDVEVADNAGNSSTSSVEIVIDKTEPVIGITSSGEYIKNANFTFRGTSSDPNADASGVEKIYYKIDSSVINSKPNDWTGWEEIPVSSKWTLEKTFVEGTTSSDLCEKAYVLNVSAVDKAGNITTPVSYEFKVDLKDPEITTTFGSEYKTDAEFVPVFNITDSSESGLKAAPDGVKITITRGGAALTKDTDYTVTQNGSDYSIGFTKSSGKIPDGNYVITVEATDKSERKTTKVHSVKLDKVGPEVNVSSPTDTQLSEWYTTNSISFDGTAKDFNAVSEISGVYYTTDSTAGASPTKEALEKTGAGAKWTKASGTDNWFFTISNLENTDNTGTNIYITALDAVGNISASTVVKNFKVDTGIPGITKPVVSDTLINATEYNSLNVTVTADVTPTSSGINKVELFNGETLLGEMTLSSGKTYSLTLTSADKSKINSGANNFVVKAKNNAGTTGESEKVNVTVDNVVPAISEISVSPEVEGGKVNGKVKISATVSDNRALADNVTWSFGNNEGQSGTVTGVSGTSKNISFDVYTTELTTSSGQFTLTLEATDEAGNKVTDSSFKLNVDQSTDKPVIEVGNFVADKTAEQVNETTNLFGVTNESGTSANNKLRAKVTDDDGLGSVTLKYRTAGSVNDFDWQTGNLNNTFVEGTKSYSLEWNLPKKEGKYEIKIEAEDNKKETTQSNVSLNSNVGAAGKTPTVRISTKTEQYVKDGTEVSISGTWDGGSSTELTRTYTIGNGTASAGETISKKEFTDKLTLSGSANANTIVTVTYVAENMFGQKSTGTYYYVIDNKTPEYNTNSLKVDGTTYSNIWKNKLSFEIDGSFTDGGSGTTDSDSGYKVGSGIKEIQYRLQAAGVTEPLTGKITPQAAASGDGWNFNQTIYGFQNGENKLYLKAVDMAGNESSETEFTIKSDTIAPTLTLNSETMKLENNVLYITDIDLESADSSKGIFVNGTITDDLSGVNNIRILNGSTEIGTIAKANIAADGSFSLKLDSSKLKNGSAFANDYTITVTGYDSLNNNTTTTFNVYVDKTDPTVDSPSVTKYVEANGKANNVNGKISITGNVSDDDKIRTLKAVLKKGENEIGTLTNNSSNTRYSITDFDTTAGELDGYKGDIVLEVTATDRSGRTTTKTETLYVDQSTDLPTYATSNATGKTAAENLFGMGNWKINGTVGDDDGVSKVEVKLDEGEYTAAFTATAGSERTSQSYDYVITDSTGEGNHTLSIKVTDKNGKWKEFSVPFAVDKAAPSVRISSASGSSYSTGMFLGSSFYIEAAASDNNGIKKVELIKVNGTSLAQDKVQTVAETSSGSGLFKMSFEKIVCYATATQADAGKYYSTALLANENGASGIVDTKGYPLVKASEAEKSYSTVYRYSVFESGDCSVTYQATDKYGRTSEATAQFKIDIDDPKVDVSKVVATNGSVNKSNNDISGFWFNTSSITVKGDDIVTDTNLTNSVGVKVEGDTSDLGSFEMNVSEGKGSFNNNRALNNGTSKIT
ncbi:MAG: Ig-like domain-containing protein, partial [Treponema sp.]|nr:Ig-like domain-containing protein [Treponema sp.]